jgi:hypothetical protein
MSKDPIITAALGKRKGSEPKKTMDSCRAKVTMTDTNAMVRPIQTGERCVLV